MSDSESDKLGYYDSGSFESGDYDWSFEEQVINDVKQPIRYEDQFMNVMSKDLPGILLNMDLQTLLMFCGTNDRIHTICNQNAFWYLKLKHDYPGYVLFYQKSKTQLGKLVYQDLLKDAKGYYVFYHQFRTCFDTFKINAHFKGAKLDTMSVLAGLRNNLSLTNDLLKKLFSLTLMYVKPSFEQHITRMESTLFLKRYKLFSTEVLVNSMLPEQYYDQFGVFMRDYPTWKEAEPLKAKIMHCVLQVYINANLNYYKRDYLSYFTLTNATLPTQCQPFRY